MRTLNNIYVLSPDEFPFTAFYKIPKQKKRIGDKSPRYRHTYFKDILTAFDIETTRVSVPDLEDDHAIMYIWQWHFDGIGCVVGRTWEQLLNFMQRLKKEMRKNERLLIYDHNLSYEFQFLSGIYDFENDEVFAIDSRKVLYCQMMNCFEFRCSMMRSNSGLDTYLKNMFVKHEKLTLDYSKTRYPWTPLTDAEMAYCINDVVGLVEAVKTDMQFSHDNFYTFPLTSTGSVRRIAKRAMQPLRDKWVRPYLPDIHLHTLLREAFRGGNTHSNRFVTGLTLDNITSMDRSSAYPYSMICDQMPMGKFTKLSTDLYINRSKSEVENLLKLLIKNNNAFLMRVEFHNIRLKDYYDPCPYLSRDKCFEQDYYSFEPDNGRLLSCKYIMTTITDVDYRIIKKQYAYDNIVIREMYTSRYGLLPDKLRDVVKDLYNKKTQLKGVPDKKIEYGQAKALLNSCYGMMVQNPVKVNILYDGGIWSDDTSKSIPEILEKHNKTAWNLYQWGVWVTAWARYHLQEGIDIVGDDFVYCDTDSVKYANAADHERDFKTYNEMTRRIADYNGASAVDPHGVRHYMGVYESEGVYEHFKTLGAKKYIDNYAGENLEVTIAGVNKGKGGAELMSAAARDGCSPYDEFRTGFIFCAAGGTDLKYHDQPTYGKYIIDGHDIEITKNVLIYDSTYEIGLSNDYNRLLNALNTIAGREQYNEHIQRLKTLDIWE